MWSDTAVSKRSDGSSGATVRPAPRSVVKEEWCRLLDGPAAPWSSCRCWRYNDGSRRCGVTRSTLATAFVLLLTFTIASQLLVLAPREIQGRPAAKSRPLRSRGHHSARRLRLHRSAKAAVGSAIESSRRQPASLLGDKCDACGLCSSNGGGEELTKLVPPPPKLSSGLDDALRNDSLHRRPYHFMCSLRTSCAAALAAGAGELLAIVVVTSAATNFERRSAIRDTWASCAPSARMKVVFLVGLRPDAPSVLRSLSNESAQHGDLIIGDFVDSYDLLTIKSVAMLRWATLECPSASYLAKVDDDMYVSLPRMRIVLSKWANNQRVVIGVTHSGRSVIDDPRHKWYNPFYEKHYGSTHYPLYATGPTYVVSMPLVRELFDASQLEPFDRMEDVFVTGICARRVGNITFVRDRGFTVAKRTLSSFRYRHVVTGHRVTPWQMRAIWSMLHTSVKQPLLKNGTKTVVVAAEQPETVAMDRCEKHKDR